MDEITERANEILAKYENDPNRTTVHITDMTRDEQLMIRASVALDDVRRKITNGDIDEAESFLNKIEILLKA